METTTREALVEALYQTEGKAEIVHGELVHLMATGFLPNQAAFEIAVRLRAYAKRTRRGYAITDNAGFLVDLPHRKSFSPDAAFYTGEPTGMKFLEGAPVFAAEVRSENDYGPQAERAMQQKRADYFAAGTLAIWDVDLQGEDVVRVFRDGKAEVPAAVYRRGDQAEAEPALPGFSMPVDGLFA